MRRVVPRAGRAGSPAPIREGCGRGSSHRAVPGRPNGSETSAPETRRRGATEDVEGSPRRRPRPRARPRRPDATHRERGRRLAGESTPLRLAGHASAARPPRPPTLARFAGTSELGLHRVGHPFSDADRALAREEDQADADAHRRLDRLQPEPEREAVSRHAVVASGIATRPAPVRCSRARGEDRRDVDHQQQTPAAAAPRGCRTRASRLHREATGRSAEDTEKSAAPLRPVRITGGRRRPVSSSIRTARAVRKTGLRARGVRRGASWRSAKPTTTRAKARHRPVGMFAVSSTSRQRQRGEEVEEPVREDRAEQAARRPSLGIRRSSTATRASSPIRPGEHVREQADRERREHEVNGGCG